MKALSACLLLTGTDAMVLPTNGIVSSTFPECLGESSVVPECTIVPTIDSEYQTCLDAAPTTCTYRVIWPVPAAKHCRGAKAVRVEFPTTPVLDAEVISSKVTFPAGSLAGCTSTHGEIFAGDFMPALCPAVQGSTSGVTVSLDLNNSTAETSFADGVDLTSMKSYGIAMSGCTTSDTPTGSDVTFSASESGRFTPIFPTPTVKFHSFTPSSCNTDPSCLTVASEDDLQACLTASLSTCQAVARYVVDVPVCDVGFLVDKSQIQVAIENTYDETFGDIERLTVDVPSVCTNVGDNFGVATTSTTCPTSHATATSMELATISGTTVTVNFTTRISDEAYAINLECTGPSSFATAALLLFPKDVVGTELPPPTDVIVTADMPAGCAHIECMVGQNTAISFEDWEKCVAGSVWGCKITHTTAARAQYCTARSSTQLRILVPSSSSAHVAVTGLSGCTVVSEEFVEVNAAVDFGKTNKCIGIRTDSSRAPPTRAVSEGSLIIELSSAKIPEHLHRPVYVVNFRDEYPHSCNFTTPGFSVGPMLRKETETFGTASGFLVTAPQELKACVGGVCRDRLVTEADLENCRTATPSDCTYAVLTNYYYPLCATNDFSELQLEVPSANHGNSLGHTLLSASITIVGGMCTGFESQSVTTDYAAAGGVCTAPIQGDAVKVGSVADGQVIMNFRNVTEVLSKPVYSARLACSAPATDFTPDLLGLSVISHYVGVAAGAGSHLSVGALLSLTLVYMSPH